MAVELADNALTSLAAVQDEGGVGSDDKIIRSINAVSQDIEDFCGRKFARHEFTSEAPEVLAGSGALWLYLSRRPIISVDEVILDETEVDEAADWEDDEGYRRSAEDDAKGRLYRGNGWPFWARGWPPPDLTSDANLDPKLRPGNIRVAYVGGYVLPAQVDEENPAATVPANLEMACIREVLARILGPTPGLLEERTAGGWSQKWADSAGASAVFLDPRVGGMLASYCSVGRWFA